MTPSDVICTLVLIVILLVTTIASTSIAKYWKNRYEDEHAKYERLHSTIRCIKPDSARVFSNNKSRGN